MSHNAATHWQTVSILWLRPFQSLFKSTCHKCVTMPYTFICISKSPFMQNSSVVAATWVSHDLTDRSRWTLRHSLIVDEYVRIRKRLCSYSCHWVWMSSSSFKTLFWQRTLASLTRCSFSQQHRFPPQD
uniref:Uncharacterized protein n=1 Tax=Molossus molossus TaxID=27622 RepID=A0A7J8I8K5_MOLMO|nr:hypothetical protein HJG59_010508 [Molossus molossus]